MARRVSIQRIKGRSHPHVPIGTVHEGWEMVPPKVGEHYMLFKDNGAIFRSTKVLQVNGPAFRTRNSHYSLKVLEEREQP